MHKTKVQRVVAIVILLVFSIMSLLSPLMANAGSATSTRIVDLKEYDCSGDAGNRYRQKVDLVLQELDLREGDTVVDVGAGDGWWSEQMARFVGPSGIIHAIEVEQNAVDKMNKRFANLPQIKPSLCPYDGTGLGEDTCDLAFISKTYHHLNEGEHVAYLKHLHCVVKPTGRLCVIEHHRALARGGGKNHAWSPALLIQQAEEAGWILVRYELIKGTYHFMAIFVQKEIFPI